MVYLKKLSNAQIILHRFIGESFNIKVETQWYESDRIIKVLSGHAYEETDRNYSTNESRYLVYPRGDLNPGSPEYETGALKSSHVINNSGDFIPSSFGSTN